MDKQVKIITIIKNGVTPAATIKKRFECPYCGCIFDATNTQQNKEFIDADAIELRMQGIDAYATCPCCNRSVYRGLEGRFCR